MAPRSGLVQICRPLSASAYQARFKHGIECDRREILELNQPIPKSEVDRTTDRLLALVARRPESLEARAGCLMDGHGDVRAEHVCLLERPVIIDCLEFSDDLRRIDPADELAFLALECEFLGAGRVGDAVLEKYEQLTADRPPPCVIAFYKSVRAMLRARLSLQHLGDPVVRHPEKWLQRTRDYVDLAARHGRRLTDG